VDELRAEFEQDLDEYLKEWEESLRAAIKEPATAPPPGQAPEER